MKLIAAIPLMCSSCVLIAHHFLINAHHDLNTHTHTAVVLTRSSSARRQCPHSWHLHTLRRKRTNTKLFLKRSPRSLISRRPRNWTLPAVAEGGPRLCGFNCSISCDIIEWHVFFLLSPACFVCYPVLILEV